MDSDLVIILELPSQDLGGFCHNTPTKTWLYSKFYNNQVLYLTNPYYLHIHVNYIYELHLFEIPNIVIIHLHLLD